MPCPETVKGIIHTAYNFSFPKLQQIIKNQAKSVSLTLDLWTAKNRQGYLGITCSFLNNKFELCEFILDLAYVRYPHTSQNIFETLEQILKEWEIQDLVYTITTDNGANIKKAIKEMEKVKWLGCTAHTLQLVVGKSLKPAETLIARAKRLIDFFLRPKQSERLEDVQKRFPELTNNQNNLEENEQIVSNFTFLL